MRTSRLRSPPVQPPLYLTKTVSLGALESHFLHNVRGPPCNAHVALLLVYLHIPIDMEGSCSAMERGRSADASLPRHDSILPDFTSTCNFVLNLATAVVSRMRATLPAMAPELCTRSVCAVSTGISGIILLTRSHQRRRSAALASSSQPCSLGRVQDAVRAYIHCNHLCYPPTARDSAPAMALTLSILSLENHVPDGAVFA